MKRRIFVQSSVLTGSGLILAPNQILCAQPQSSALNNFERLTILHTNDTHSHIEPLSEKDKKFPNQGGVARRMTLINNIRSEVENVLLFDAGDIFQGTPYFNMFHGKLELELMSKMGYDCATMGNHDFDGGMDGFKNALEFANFPFVCSNYDFSNTILNGLTKPFSIFEKGSLKIGVFGIGVPLNGLVPKHLYGETIYLDAIQKAQEMADFLKNESLCDWVVCLSHLGHFPRQFEICDPILAKETHGIDLIIGGHTHTLLERPEVHKNSKGEKVLINQVGCYGAVLGRIDLYFGEGKSHYQTRLLPIG